MPIDFHNSSNKWSYTSRTAEDQWIKMVEEYTRLSGKRVLDLGCGGGIYSKALAVAGAEQVTAMDFSQEMLEADLLNRTGRSILHELSDDELAELTGFIKARLSQLRHIEEKDRWTVWIAGKR
ncbi:class I SAM-dependent methyltransferase [Paenibacillus sp. HW567]|uniref:class I SAM-dependent methyltransferase n=1 Tax=Paenibacillus sp. HW567 TaxID=1034769 RepID=UPI000382949A|nr:methyltransferase domain-containing protein [Paenibacillus sp. HW567]